MRALLILTLALGLLAAGLWLEYRRFADTPIALGSESVTLDIPRGTSLQSLSRDLTERGWLDHPWFFMAMAKLDGSATQIKAGEFAVPDGITPRELLALLRSGRVVQHAITLVEGWTFREVLTTVRGDARLVHELGDDATPELVMERLERPGQHPEGRFFPDTYYFTRGTSELAILRRAYQAMERILAEEWATRSEDLPITTPDEALILASIVEKETGLASERPEIAGVFIRRLRIGMRLQTDPTVIYGLGEAFDGNLRRADLRGDTPYNTYTRDGLPPTPIALPGREAIHAVLHPADGDALYFVARGDGSHQFSATLAEHNRAVRKYQLGRD
jgi:UPF0755 protein